MKPVFLNAFWCVCEYVTERTVKFVVVVIVVVLV